MEMDRKSVYNVVAMGYRQRLRAANLKANDLFLLDPHHAIGLK
jgi:hypothetical protein